MYRLVVASLIVASVSLGPGMAGAQGLEGSSLFSIGIGSGLRPVYGSASLPSIRTSYEYFWNENIALGSTLSYGQSSFERLGAPELKQHTVIVGGRASYHFQSWLRGGWLDPYAGASIGYGYAAFSTPAGYSDFSSAGSRFFALHAGARLIILPRVAGFVEIGNELLGDALLTESGAIAAGGLSFHF